MIKPPKNLTRSLTEEHWQALWQSSYLTGRGARSKGMPVETDELRRSATR
jgi:hypothetical protein